MQNNIIWKKYLTVLYFFFKEGLKNRFKIAIIMIYMYMYKCNNINDWIKFFCLVSICHIKSIMI